MRARGVNVSVGELRRRLELDDDRRWAVAGRIQSEGLAATLSAASTALEQVASRLTTASGEPQTTSIRTEDVFDDMCRELRLIADAILAIAALDALGCAFGCPFCCLIAIGFGVVGALMMLAVDFIC